MTLKLFSFCLSACVLKCLLVTEGQMLWNLLGTFIDISIGRKMLQTLSAITAIICMPIPVSVRVRSLLKHAYPSENRVVQWIANFENAIYSLHATKLETNFREPQGEK